MTPPDGQPWDAVVVGGGPAGLSAALWLGRYRRRTLVLDSGEYRNRWTTSTHGYLGFDGVGPDELLQRARADLSHYEHVEVVEATVHKATSAEHGFIIETPESAESARRVVLATGTRDVFPEVGNFYDFYGRSVFTCPTCDGYEARGKEVVVLGWNPDVAALAEHLLEWASSVAIVTDGAALEASAEDSRDLWRNQVSVYEEGAVELLGKDGALEGIRLDSGRVVRAEMAFFDIAQNPSNELAQQLGCETDPAGCVAVNQWGMTSVEGVYAAGDLVPGPQLVQLATASGAVAGIGCARSFMD